MSQKTNQCIVHVTSTDGAMIKNMIKTHLEAAFKTFTSTIRTELDSINTSDDLIGMTNKVDAFVNRVNTLHKHFRKEKSEDLKSIHIPCKIIIQPGRETERGLITGVGIIEKKIFYSHDGLEKSIGIDALCIDANDTNDVLKGGNTIKNSVKSPPSAQSSDDLMDYCE